MAWLHCLPGILLGQLEQMHHPAMLVGTQRLPSWLTDQASQPTKRSNIHSPLQHPCLVGRCGLVGRLNFSANQVIGREFRSDSNLIGSSQPSNELRPRDGGWLTTWLSKPYAWSSQQLSQQLLIHRRSPSAWPLGWPMKSVGQLASWLKFHSTSHGWVSSSP